MTDVKSDTGHLRQRFDVTLSQFQSQVQRALETELQSKTQSWMQPPPTINPFTGQPPAQGIPQGIPQAVPPPILTMPPPPPYSPRPLSIVSTSSPPIATVRVFPPRPQPPPSLSPPTSQMITGTFTRSAGTTQDIGPQDIETKRPTGWSTVSSDRARTGGVNEKWTAVLGPTTPDVPVVPKNLMDPRSPPSNPNYDYQTQNPVQIVRPAWLTPEMTDRYVRMFGQSLLPRTGIRHPYAFKMDMTLDPIPAGRDQNLDEIVRDYERRQQMQLQPGQVILQQQQQQQPNVPPLETWPRSPGIPNPQNRVPLSMTWSRTGGRTGGKQGKTSSRVDQLIRSLPKEGVIRQSGGFYYVDLGPEWQKERKTIVHEISREVKHPSSQTRHMLHKSIRRQGEFMFYSPPSPVGLHISLGPELAKPFVGKTVQFRTGPSFQFDHDNIGRTSSFAPNHYHVRWYVAPVVFQATDGRTIVLANDPHISLAIYGLYSNHHK